MTATVVVGMQAGDEGKGKVVDILSDNADFVVRFNGGDNAGHTIVRDGKTYKLHLIPSGVFNPNAVCIIASGVVVNPDTLLAEIDYLERAGIDTSNVFVSEAAHVILPEHISRDVQQENDPMHRIGTTKRGIGPAYADRALRVGLRMGDLGNEQLTVPLGGFAHQKAVYWHDKLESRIVDTTEMVLGAKDTADILLEGAQGHFLDIDHGTYPYVTSSHTTAGAATLGTGLGPHDIDKVVGVMKLYATRVGEGPFPGEIFGEAADLLVERGNEYGTTTGRRRRVGFMDYSFLANVVSVSNIDEICVTKMDVLYPELRNISRWENLTLHAEAQIARIEEFTGAPVTMISVGPDREQTIYR